MSASALLIAVEPEGLLLYGDDAVAQSALQDALEDVYQVECLGSFAGATTVCQSAYSLLRQAGVPDDLIEARRPAWVDYATELYQLRLAEERLPQLVAAGARSFFDSLCERGDRLVAVSRQLTPLLQLRLAGAGLDLFDAAVGGEAVRYHTGLYPVARQAAAPERLAGWPRQLTVAVGAAPGLVCRAHSDPVHALLWADPWCPQPATMERAADRVVTSFDELAQALDRLRPRPRSQPVV